MGRGKLIRLIRAKVMTELEQSNITRHGRDAHALPSLPPGRTGKGRTEEGEGERANGQEREERCGGRHKSRSERDETKRGAE